MKEIIITSSVLILCIMLLRMLFQGKISSRLQYALWLLAALRLLMPAGVQAGNLNEVRLMDLIKSAEADTGDILQRLEEPITITLSMTEYAGQRAMRFLMPESAGNPVSLAAKESGLGDGADGPSSIFIAGRLGASWLDMFGWIWRVGMLVTALWILVTNLFFYHSLCRGRREFELSEDEISFLSQSLPPRVCRKLYVTNGKERQNRNKEDMAGAAGNRQNKKKGIKLYILDNLASPCLYGLPGKEAIYLTPDIVSDKHKLCHVLAHELCHKKHGDSFWSLLRSVLVTVYWFHPLVWSAVVLSKRDCELACDEAVLLMLGEQERISYGETLLSIITRKGKLSDLACTATTMTGSGKNVKERIQLIAKAPQMLGITMAVVLAFAAAVFFFCFTKDSRLEGCMVSEPGEVTILGRDMQLILPASIGGISGWTEEDDKEDIVIYQVASGREVGRFCKMDLKDVLQLMDEGRQIIPLGDYGYNYVLWDKLGVAREREEHTYAPNFSTYTDGVSVTYTPAEEENSVTGEVQQPVEMAAESAYEASEDDAVHLPAEDVNVDELPGSDCYIYLKADYSKVKDKYLEEMEFINGELEAITEDVILLEFTEEYRDQLYETLAKHKTLYVGEAFEVGALVHALPAPEGFIYSGISIDDREEGKYKLCISYERQNTYMNETDAHMIFFDAVMLFASIRNLDECVFVADGPSGEASWTYYRTELEEIFDYGLRYQDCEEDIFVGYMQLLYSDIVEYLSSKDTQVY